MKGSGGSTGLASRALPTLHFSVDLHRHEAEVAIFVGEEKERRLATILLQLIDALVHVLGVLYRLLGDFDDDVARLDAFLRRGTAVADGGDDDAVDTVLDAVLTANRR